MNSWIELQTVEGMSVFQHSFSSPTSLHVLDVPLFKHVGFLLMAYYQGFAEMQVSESGIIKLGNI